MNLRKMERKRIVLLSFKHRSRGWKKKTLTFYQPWRTQWSNTSSRSDTAYSSHSLVVIVVGYDSVFRTFATVQNHGHF